jgi:hypothetical protein
MLADYAFVNLRPAAILTNSYVAATKVDAPGNNGGVQPNKFNTIIFYIDFTIGSLTDVQLKVEFSHDGTNWFQETFSNISGATDTMSLGVHKIAATGKYILILTQVAAQNVRISAIGTGTVTASSLSIDAVFAWR